MQLLFVTLTVCTLALLKRGHELGAATSALLALVVMLIAFSGVPAR